MEIIPHETKENVYPRVNTMAVDILPMEEVTATALMVLTSPSQYWIVTTIDTKYTHASWGYNLLIEMQNLMIQWGSITIWYYCMRYLQDIRRT